MDHPKPAVIELPGPRIRDEENAAIRQQIAGVFESGQTCLVLDFAKVEFADSSCLGMLVSMLNRAAAAHGDIRLCRLQKPVAAIFHLTRMHKIFDIFDTPEDALASFDREPHG
ncbi:MAG: STAS domain-containing protein [bacterium]|nr:STAS domain-containing protein [Candidatus Sumerlaeota bacterium]